MSASPTRVVASPSPAERVVPLHPGNRVLESIAQQQALRSLLGFSAFHEQVQQSHRPAQSAASWDLFHTECFVRDEVLQLICDRVQVITQADGVMIAMAEEDGVTCPAASGALLVNRGRSLSYESEFLGQCLYAGRIARSDDCETHPRAKT